MIPGEVKLLNESIVINSNKEAKSFIVSNRGTRPVIVRSHSDFSKVNRALYFDREDSKNQHLDIPSGSSVRFEPGDTKTIYLVRFGN